MCATCRSGDLLVAVIRRCTRECRRKGSVYSRTPYTAKGRRWGDNTTAQRQCRRTAENWKVVRGAAEGSVQPSHEEAGSANNPVRGSTDVRAQKVLEGEDGETKQTAADGRVGVPVAAE